ncbi:M23 family metallopeptidase [Clostridium sp. BSD9I1]|uniref:M23 family metallopeptidase n=1 Tax=Clostridium sp. BSD9I1 TaxID=2003589 RepID=UPI0016446916|nr:M23 family metallopeptidase [Clostridium sp. BSD9I1]
MKNKNFSKIFNFFKREGFYVVLFLCLCILATVAVVTTRDNRQAKIEQNKTSVVEQEKKKDTAQVTEKPYTDYDNAEQVKKTTNTETKVNKEVKNTEKTATVSKTVDTKFGKPVEGIIGRQYSEEPVFWKSTNSYRPNFGIDIKCELGKPVVAALDGKVESVKNDTVDGIQVIVDHQNGLKTVYSNLDSKVSISAGKVVKKGDKLGVVGRTTLRAMYEAYGDHLHFAVLKDKDFVNPDKYIKY